MSSQWALIGDKIREATSKASIKEKPTLQAKYRILRNKVTSKIRQDNEDRIKFAKDENKIWNVVNDAISPNKKQAWKIKVDTVLIEKKLQFNHLNCITVVDKPLKHDYLLHIAAIQFYNNLSCIPK